MIESGSKDTPITRETIEEKIDVEFRTFTGSVPAEQRDSSFTAQLEVLAQIRDAFYVMPIPDELHPSIINREGILREVYLFWLDEATKDKPDTDMLSLPYECTSNWLYGVRHEYRTTLLRERLAAEYEGFIAEERQKMPEEIIKDAGKIACMDDLLMALNNEELEPQNVDALLTIECPLHTIYDEFLSQDSESRIYDLIDTANEVAQARHYDILTENVLLKPEDSMIKQHVEEYVRLYGGQDYSGQQDLPDHEPEL